MLEFIAQYWLTFIFGIIASGLSIAVTRLWKLYKSIKQTKQEEEKKEILAAVDKKLEEQNEHLEDVDKEIKNEIENLDQKIHILTSGVLSAQGHGFRDACRRLLKPDHFITIDEYEQICRDHMVYNNLGGNHLGDQMFQSIEHKFEQQTILPK